MIVTMPEILTCDNYEINPDGILQGTKTAEVEVFGSRVFITFVIYLYAI